MSRERESHEVEFLDEDGNLVERRTERTKGAPSVGSIPRARRLVDVQAGGRLVAVLTADEPYPLLWTNPDAPECALLPDGLHGTLNGAPIDVVLEAATLLVPGERRVVSVTAEALRNAARHAQPNRPMLLSVV